MLCPDREATFLQDPEGLQLATSINRHLPSNIRVLSCQRVPKSFRARQQAASRRYEYFLPAWVIGITGEDAEEDARRLKLLREALRSFQACLPGLPVCVQASKAADCHMSWRGWDLGRGMGVHKGFRSYQWLESISAGLGAQVTQCQYCIHNSARPS